MGAEKHVTPILLIILVLVALVCTYAWFSASPSTKIGIELYTGVSTSFTISDGQGASGNNNQFVFDDLYSGQKGYKSDGTAYTDADAPFYLFKTISYTMKGQANTIVDIGLEKLVVEVGAMYLYSFDDTLKNVFGLTTQQIAALTNDTRLNYYVTSTAYASSASATPSGQNPSPFYMVYNTSTNKVTHFIFPKDIVQTYVTYDYWVSNNTDNEGAGVLPTDTHTSAKGAGISLTYPTDVSQAGITNYVGIYAGFYGFDGTKYTECIFSDANFQGSTFSFTFSAGGM